MKAYEEILEATSTRHAPWFAIPADHKWYRNVAVSEILVHALKGLDLKYPAATFDPTGLDLHKEDPAVVAKDVAKRSDPARKGPAKRKAKS